VRWVEGEPDRQAAQISWEVSRSLTAEHRHHRGVVSARALLRPLQLSSKPLPVVTWVGETPAPTALDQPANAPEF